MTAADLLRTRAALHAVAELVLAGPQHRISGTIKLRVSAGGFRTWSEPSIAVSGTDVVSAGIAHPLSGSTARMLADAIGLAAGAPIGVYAGSGEVSIDEPLEADPVAARTIADAFARGDAALRSLARDVEPVLWPEHFDVGIRLGDVNYGVSPGDAYLAAPYAYVGIDSPPEDAYWNAPFGAARLLTALPDAADLHGFFDMGRRYRS